LRTYGDNLPPRLTKVDELILDYHGSLSPDDECYFLREYTKGGGFSASATNQLIHNLKKPVERRGQYDYRYKGIAIEKAATELRETISRDFLIQATLVPIPPSAARNDPSYDDRMSRVIRSMTGELPADFRELILQLRTVPKAHLSGDLRPTVAEILENYAIDEALAEPEPRVIALFDDILTAGSHFTAAKRLLTGRFPNVRVVGIFIARRIFPQE
jgi:predicted amidophosphoribosyltransferase